MQDMSQELIQMHQDKFSDKYKRNIPLSNQTVVNNQVDDMHSFDASKNGCNSFMMNDTNRLIHDFTDP
jgi:hypothetical protein